MESKHAVKVSLCITVFNEEKHIARLLRSILHQTKLPDEVVIVDGGSSDNTVAVIQDFQKKESFFKKHLKFLTFPNTNRPKGRNLSIEHATHDVIAITDAGCELDKEWLAEITLPFLNKKTQVVSGYYAGRPRNALEAALVPFVLVTPEKLNPASFLPSTRSMAMKKSVWEKMGGFPEEYRWNEDYVFSKRLEKEGILITFAQKAIVYWLPRETLREGWKMFYAFAKGDAQAGIWRPKVLLLFLRVFLGILLVGYAFLIRSTGFTLVLGILGLLYLMWAILKHFRSVKDPFALIFLPIWQLVADYAVFCGSVVGGWQRMKGVFS